MLKIGDIVRIKKNICDMDFYIHYMEPYCGKVATVVKNLEGFIKLDIDNEKWWWREEMVEPIEDNIIKIYFCELGEEISELFSNILKTKKRIMIVLGIILFILGCFIWKPLCLLIITGAIMLCATICIMSIPLIGALTTYILFHLSTLDDKKYPLLNETLSVICSIIVFVFITYLAYDCAIKDLWYQPELWNEILNL